VALTPMLLASSYTAYAITLAERTFVPMRRLVHSRPNLAQDTANAQGFRTCLRAVETVMDSYMYGAFHCINNFGIRRRDGVARNVTVNPMPTGAGDI